MCFTNLWVRGLGNNFGNLMVIDWAGFVGKLSSNVLMVTLNPPLHLKLGDAPFAIMRSPCRDIYTLYLKNISYFL